MWKFGLQCVNSLGGQREKSLCQEGETKSVGFNLDFAGFLFISNESLTRFLSSLLHLNASVYTSLRAVNLPNISIITLILQEIRSTDYFAISAEILARSLANFYCQYADRHMNFKFMRHVSELERAIRPFVIVKTNCSQF